MCFEESLCGAILKVLLAWFQCWGCFKPRRGNEQRTGATMRNYNGSHIAYSDWSDNRKRTEMHATEKRRAATENTWHRARPTTNVPESGVKHKAWSVTLKKPPVTNVTGSVEHRAPSTQQSTPPVTKCNRKASNTVYKIRNTGHPRRRTEPENVRVHRERDTDFAPSGCF